MVINVGEETKAGVVNTLPGEPVVIQAAQGDLSEAAVVSPPQSGTADIDDLAGTITYVPSEDFIGLDELVYWACPTDRPGFAGPVTIVYEVTDPSGATAVCVVQFTVVAAAGGGAVGECEKRVVISEVAWSGTQADPKHEWIELRNLEDGPVDLGGWTLRWRRKLPETEEERLWRAIPLSGQIAPYEPDADIAFAPVDGQVGAWWVLWDSDRGDGHYLLERETDEVVLHVPADLIYEEELPLGWIAGFDDRGDIIELIDPSGCSVDTANADNPERDGWAAGSLWPTATMERIDPFGPDVDANWRTNLGLIRIGFDAWANLIHGTPKHENSPVLSEAVAKRGFEVTRHPMGEPIVLRFDPLPEWPADETLWRVLVTRPPSDEVLEADWTLEATDSGGIAVRVFTNGFRIGEILVWVRTPSGDVLVAPISINP